MRKRWLLSIVIMLFPFVASFAADPEDRTGPEKSDTILSR